MRELEDEGVGTVTVWGAAISNSNYNTGPGGVKVELVSDGSSK